MTALAMSSKDLTLLPWTEYAEDSRRYHKVVVACLASFICLFVVLGGLIDPPAIDRAQLEKIPTRVASMILEKKKLPVPVLPKIQPVETKPKPEVKIEVPKLAKVKPVKPKPKVKPKVKPKPKTVVKPKIKATAEQRKKAREKAKKSGLLAMSQQLSSLRNMASVGQLKKTKLKRSTGSQSIRTDRDLITSNAKTGSGGIRTTAVAKRDSAQLAGRTSTVIDAPEELLAQEFELENAVRQRTSEEIALTFDKHKSSFYSLYRRALRSQLGLQGRIVFALTISPDGDVSACSVISSELNNPKLERKLAARIRLMDFGAKDVEPWSDNYHIDFSPAG